MRLTRESISSFRNCIITEKNNLSESLSMLLTQTMDLPYSYQNHRFLSHNRQPHFFEKLIQFSQPCDSTPDPPSGTRTLWQWRQQHKRQPCPAVDDYVSLVWLPATGDFHTLVPGYWPHHYQLNLVKDNSVLNGQCPTFDDLSPISIPKTHTKQLHWSTDSSDASSHNWPNS